MKYDMKNDIAADVAIPNRAYTTNETFVGEPIDLRGYQSCTFLFYSGQITDGTYTPVVYESDTGAFSGEETAVADADFISTEAACVLSGSTDQTVKRLGYIGNKRYVQARMTSASVTSGGNVGALVIRGHAHDAAVS